MLGPEAATALAALQATATAQPVTSREPGAPTVQDLEDNTVERLLGRIQNMALAQAIVQGTPLAANTEPAPENASSDAAHAADGTQDAWCQWHRTTAVTTPVPTADDWSHWNWNQPADSWPNWNGMSMGAWYVIRSPTTRLIMELYQRR